MSQNWGDTSDLSVISGVTTWERQTDKLETLKSGYSGTVFPTSDLVDGMEYVSLNGSGVPQEKFVLISAGGGDWIKTAILSGNVGTASLVNTGIAQGDVPVLTVGGKLETARLDAGTNAGQITTLSTGGKFLNARLNLGAGADQILVLDGSGNLSMGGNITAGAFKGDGSELTGTPTPDVNSLAKAWVNFDGTGVLAIRDSFNVSSVTDNGTGDYTINFTTPFANANYVTVALNHSLALNDYRTILHSVAGVAAGSVRILNHNTGNIGGNVDADIICVLCFGDQ